MKIIYTFRTKLLYRTCKSQNSASEENLMLHITQEMFVDTKGITGKKIVSEMIENAKILISQLTLS